MLLEREPLPRDKNKAALVDNPTQNNCLKCVASFIAHTECRSLTDPFSPPSVPPGALAVRMATAYQISQALFAATSLAVFDLIASGRTSSAEIAVALNANPPMTLRLLRALAAFGVVRDEGGARFQLSEIGRCLCKDAPNSMRNVVLMFGGDQFALPFSKLSQCVLTGKNGYELLTGDEIAFAAYEGNPDAAAIFDGAMTAISARTGPALAKAYDFSTSKHLVDIGGGQGQVLCSVLKSYTKLRGTLFDLPRVIEGARALIAREGVTERCDAVGGDMFAAVPSGGDVYLLSHVLHDWDDERSIRILTACRQTVTTDATVLVLDRVMPEIVQPTSAAQANHLIDLTMMVRTAGGLERTALQFEALLKAAGLRLEAILPTEVADSVIVTKLA
jgi:hypothetical protein